MMNFTLKQARQFADKTQMQAAAYLGVCVETYRAIELNPERATIEQAKKLSDFFNMPYSQIFFSTEST